MREGRETIFNSKRGKQVGKRGRLVGKKEDRLIREEDRQLDGMKMGW